MAADDRSKSSSLLKLLDELYVGGMPGSDPAQQDIDGLKIPPKMPKMPTPEEDDEEERVSPPFNIEGSY